MGALIFLGICWYLVSGRDNPNVRKKARGIMGTIPKLIAGFFLLIPATVILTVLAAMVSGLFSSLIGLIPVIAIIAIISKIVKAGKENTKRESNDEYRAIKEQVNSGQGFKLSRSTSKRVRIIRKFNKKFDLNLTDDQIERIMNASYVSYSWEKEIYEMTKDYKVDIEWLKSDTDWLKAYMKAFPVMDIASDFTVQKKIVLDSYYQIFKGVEGKTYYSIDEMIYDVNNKYLVSFDEVTFMIANRFLRENGYNFELPRIGVIRNESEVDRLAKQYDRMSGADSTGMPLQR